MPDTPTKPPGTPDDKLPPGMLPEPVRRILEQTRSLRRIADALVSVAHEKRQHGELSLEGYLAVVEQHQQLINQANRAVYQVAGTLPPLEAQVVAVEGATKQLEEAAKNLRRATDILAISAKLVLAVTSLVAAVFRPDPLTISTSAESIVNVVRVIRDQVHR